MIGLDSYSRHVFNKLFVPHFDLYLSLNRLPIWNSKNCIMFPLASVAGSLQGHWRGFISRNYVVWPIFFLMNFVIYLKRTHVFIFICLHCSWCRAVWRPWNVFRYINLSAVYILFLVLWNQREYSEKSEINDWFRLIFKQVFNYFDPIFIYISLWIDCQFKIRKIAVCFLWLSWPGQYRVTDEASLAETT